jgi:hypothetical protein
MPIMKSFFTLLFAVIITISASSQQAARMSGEVLVMTTPKGNIEQIVSAAQQKVGVLPALKVDELVSAPMRTWKLSFNENQISMREMLYTLQKIDGVKFAQVNHIVADRVTTPNDPFYGQQWHHNQQGDHDIDSDLAWDITTGGVTATGDEIVVCVVETSGTKWDQADIIDNHWTNNNEIPNNGIDDDNNGYIDDIDGWNSSNNTDNIGTGNHGTQVSSMIGAKGNNGTGITGVNWDVKIMQVHMGGISESNVVAAYTYPMVMRKLYNQTNGQQGAFVVATNSSWGTDYGQPADAPIWCAMYDSLGTYGVLSCGATSNSELNIDAVGDLPTACPSEFMLAVTATDNNDVRTFSGYGQTTIDLGAPGDNVYLAGNNNYGNTSGTSFASPCVAGAIALLYSAPCTSIMAITYGDPSLGAQFVRDYIFNGVDPISNLTTETVTGGRLNVFNSLNLLIENCSNDECIIPLNLTATQQAGTLNYNLTWVATPAINSVNIRYQIQGGEWILVENISANSLVLNELLACTSYNVEISANCESGNSEWSSTYTFTTDGCCENPTNIVISNLTENSAVVTWSPVLAADSYMVIVIDPAGEQIIYNDITQTSYTISGLAACSIYDVIVTSVCVGNNPPPVSYTFTTLGCGDCQDFTYCASFGDSDLEWIDNVTLNTIDNDSGNDNGYGDYRSVSTTLEVGNEYTFSVTPGFSGSSYTEYFRVWIDYNNNGTFESNEKIADSNAGVNTTFNQTFTVPAGTPTGAVAMRVAMAYVGIFSGNPPAECGENTYGETEDYCITIIDLSSVNETSTNTFDVYPNPASDLIRWTANEKINAVKIYNAQGQLVVNETTPTHGTIDVSALESGIYIVHATNQSGLVFTKQIMIAPR